MGCNRLPPILALLLFFNIFYSFDAIDTITGAQFICDTENRILVSSNGNFKLGFFSPGRSPARYVGIWVNEISQATVVWVANRENPIKNSGGIFKIGGDGNLGVFIGNESSPLWSTNVSVPTGSSTAKLLDSGNLVLVAGNRWSDTVTIIWQSFDHPTDTLLPGMKFGLNRKNGLNSVLTSWKSIDDPAPGEISSRVDTRGSPQIFIYKKSVPHWRAGPWNGHNLIGLPDIATRIRSHKADLSDWLVNLRLVNNDNETYITSQQKKSSLFSILKLEPTATTKRLIRQENGKWVKFGRVPRDLCDEYARCGANAICNEDTFSSCACLPGFEPSHPQDWYLKCAEMRKKDDCGKGDGEGFVRMESVKLPDARTSTVYGNINSKECERECLKSCNCTGYAILDVHAGGPGCIAWYGELIDMRVYKDGQDFYIRVDAVELAANTRKNSKQFLAKKDVLAFIVVPAASEVIPMILFIYYCWRRQAKIKGEKKERYRRQMLLLDSARNVSNHRDSSNAKSIDRSGNIEITFFELNTVKAATENFSSAKKLGRGGFGLVFMGQLPDGQEIAVKRLSKNSGQGIEEFKNEILLTAKLQHRNLVRLLGCCIEEDEKMLIYEFMPNKSLDYFIFDQSRKLMLDWKMRFEIILGIARGILYLHQDSRLRIIHRDLKVSNILLDGEMKPKISDLGTARIFGEDEIQEYTKRVVGTFGYMSPEYALGGLFSVKSDIFSFGVILLEIICGKKNWGFYHESSSSNLLKYIWVLWRDKKAMEIVDSCIVDSCPPHEVLRCIQVGLLCVQDDARDRPTVSTVNFMLCNETILPYPKQSTFAFRRNSPESSTRGTNCSANEVTITTFVGR